MFGHRATHPFWLSAFLDVEASVYGATTAFWAGATGYEPSAARGDRAEFRTLRPPAGDDHLSVQRLGAGPSRLHLDLHVADPRAAAREAQDLGATVGAEPPGDGYVVLRSPGGLTFCFVTHPAAVAAAPATWPGGHSSVVDQVCLDIPAWSWDTESAFWERLTGWERSDSPGHPEFQRLVPPAAQPLRLLLQRLGEADGDVRAHLDLATTDRGAETGRHVALGAQPREVRAGWTVLADPAGAAYCLTDRTPRTRVPGGGGAH